MLLLSAEKLGREHGLDIDLLLLLVVIRLRLQLALSELQALAHQDINGFVAVGNLHGE